MEESKKTLKYLLLGILLYAVPLLIMGTVLANNKLSYFIGLISGCIVAAFIAIHLYRSLDYCLDLDPESAEKTMKRKTMLRSMIMLVAVGVACCIPQVVSPIGLFIGMMGLKISAYVQPFIHR